MSSCVPADGYQKWLPRFLSRFFFLTKFCWKCVALNKRFQHLFPVSAADRVIGGCARKGAVRRNPNTRACEQAKRTAVGQLLMTPLVLHLFWCTFFFLSWCWRRKSPNSLQWPCRISASRGTSGNVRSRDAPWSVVDHIWRRNVVWGMSHEQTIFAIFNRMETPEIRLFFIHLTEKNQANKHTNKVACAPCWMRQ